MNVKRVADSKIIAASIILFVIAKCMYLLFPLSVGTKIYLGYEVDSVLNFTELTAKYGYQTEEHSVVTEDGYILQLFRIVKAKNCHGKKKEPPVILMHGFLQSSDSWIDAGPNAGLAYLIADACFDLWVGNVRGNYYSRRHISMDPAEAQYWQFYADDIGTYDIPATVDYVLEHSATKKVNYIGFSQGALAFFIMCSERPGYCKKVNLMIGLAPASKLNNTKSRALRIAIKSISKLEGVLSKLGLLELFTHGALTQELMSFFAHFCDFTNTMAYGILALLDSGHPGSVTTETVRTLSGHFPAGTSAHNFAYYSGPIEGSLGKFDYGKSTNLDKYGSEIPPKYNISAVSVPVLILYGNNDGLVDAQDVKWLEKQLPNVIETKAVSDPLWTHFDFNYSQYIKEFVFGTINEHLDKFSNIA